MRTIGKSFKDVSANLLKIRPSILFAFCFLIYMPKFNLPAIIQQIISVIIPLAYILFNIDRIGKIGKKQWAIVLSAILLSLLSCVFPLLHGTGDFSYFAISLIFYRKALTFVALLLMIEKHHGRERSLQYFMYYFILTHIAYVIGTLLFVFIPGLRSVWFSIFEKEVMYGNEAGHLFRVGWRGFAGFRVTLYCTISVIFALYLRYGAKPAQITNQQFLFAYLFNIAGNMFYGRSGLLISLIVSILGFLYWNRKNLKRIVVAALSSVILILGIGSLRYIPLLQNWYEWMSSPIINLVTTGDMQNSSFDRLQEMNQVKIEGTTLLVGDGYYTEEDGHYYMRTDAGFVRNVLFWGLIGALISYGTTLYSIFTLFRLNKLLVLQILILFIAFEYKGAAYYEFLPIMFILNTAMYDSKTAYNHKTELA
ncbi:hypothetical protein IJ765_02630 [Candidatus Saccharibacteria bacterium]|nr:hypothetical protein [Candidatus Saccharibacteria bacterium]